MAITRSSPIINGISFGFTPKTPLPNSPTETQVIITTTNSNAITVYRIAVFDLTSYAGTYPDPADPAVQALFWVDGSIANPTASQAEYGQALIDVYGPVPKLNINTYGEHYGSIGGGVFDAGAGTVTET